MAHAQPDVSLIEKMFRPRSIAVIGASPQEGVARNRLLKVILKQGFAGAVYPITPSHAEVEGLKAYKQLADLPQTPDLALIITPASTVPGLIEECGAAGVRSAIVYSAGFEEIESGKELAKQLAVAARRSGVAVLGPNGQGLWSVKSKTVLSFSAVPLSIETMRHAPVAIISQSGALSGTIGAHLQKSGLGCSYIVSVGNETCLDALDMLAWVIEQEDVRVVTLYLEGLNDGWRLLPLAARARARGVQIVVLRAGRSAFGQEATASHTGKIASPYAIYRDVLDQAGVVMVESLAEALAATQAFAVLPAPRTSGDPKGGVAILSSSGGAGALLADHGEERGVPMATFSPACAERLETILPEFARKANPVDLTGQIRANPNLFRDSLGVLVEDPRTEAIVIQFASSGMRDLRDNADAFKAAARDGAMPVLITFAAETIDPAVKAEFLACGILLSDDPDNTMRALRWLYDRKRMSTRSFAERGPGATSHPAPCSWAEMMEFLERANVTPARWRVLGAKDRASDALIGLNAPFVVKALPSEAEHKTELGLVKLRVASAAEVETHAAAFLTALGKPEMAVLVQEMITDGVEVVLSCLRDTDFGPVLSIGSGGVAIELYRDVTYLALPVNEAQVEAALRKLKLWTVLQGFRGAPPADVPALVRAAVSFGEAMLATPDLAEAEINPVLVRPKSKGVVAVDFLGVARPSA